MDLKREKAEAHKRALTVAGLIKRGRLEDAARESSALHEHLLMLNSHILPEPEEEREPLPAAEPSSADVLRLHRKQPVESP